MPSIDIIVAVTGGIAAFKSAALTSLLVQNDHSVQAVMTESAQKFLGPATLMALTGKPVATELFDPAMPLGAHIELARDAKLLCVAPATANFLANAAHGVADDLLSTLYLCFTGPVIVAPAMNVEMWNQPSVQRNINQLRADGVNIVDPQEGWLSCRQKGMGRMADPDTIVKAIEELLP
jgi:phosphopantothenoylcysteine decarboxylase/phosphopantothenate--cysteine ligase